MQRVKLLQNVKTFNEKGELIVYPFGSTFDYSRGVMEWIRTNKISHVVFDENAKHDSV